MIKYYCNDGLSFVCFYDFRVHRPMYYFTISYYRKVILATIQTASYRLWNIIRFDITFIQKKLIPGDPILPEKEIVFNTPVTCVVCVRRKWEMHVGVSKRCVHDVRWFPCISDKAYLDSHDVNLLRCWVITQNECYICFQM